MNWKYVPLLFLFLFGVATTVVADVSHFDVPVVETECDHDHHVSNEKNKKSDNETSAHEHSSNNKHEGCHV
ncbi:MAG: hypothetical protein JNM93_00270 [Bacteriovoracaceae bacterium]|nr:hypothetical protein [Bacteriovoracaceae bacterium]